MELCEKYDVSHKTMLRTLRLYKLKVDKKPKKHNEVLDRIGKQKLIATDLIKLSEETGIPYNSIIAYMRQRGWKRLTKVERVMSNYDDNYISTHTLGEMANLTGLNKLSIQKYCNKHGIRYRKVISKFVLTQEEFDRYGAQKLAEMYGCSVSKIRDNLKHSGVDTSKTSYDYSKITLELMRTTLGKDVAKRFGMCPNSLYGWCMRNNMPWLRPDGTITLPYSEESRKYRNKSLTITATHNMNIYELMLEYDVRCFNDLRTSVCQDLGISSDTYDDAMLNGTYESLIELGFKDKYIIENTITQIFA